MSDNRYTNRGFGLRQVIGGQVVRDYASALVDRMRAEGFSLAAGDLTFHLAQEFGFCYGVDRAIEYAYETREKFPEKNLFITGEIIHNPRVNAKLTELGIRFLDGSDGAASLAALQPDDVVLLPAFGVPVATMDELRDAGCIVVDTTCGSVLNVWKNVERYAKEGFTALIHGKWDHEETRATSSRALLHPRGQYVVVLNMDEAEVVAEYVEHGGDATAFRARFAHAISPEFDPDVHLFRLGCANQTTMLAGESLAIAERLRQALLARFGPEESATRFRAFDTICSATQERQDALHALLSDRPLDVLLVIGGYNSSNTTHLLEIGLEKGVPTFHIQDASAISGADRIRHQRLHEKTETTAEGWLEAGPRAIGVTAGASTPNAEIEHVIRRVAGIRGSSRVIRVLSSRAGEPVTLPKKPPFRPGGRRAAATRPAPRRRMSAVPAARVVVDRSGPLHAEIVVVGREPLRGQLRDGNASWIAGELSRRGALVHRVTIVDDLERSIMNAVAEARDRGVHLIVTTGGLGPAQDDRTLAGLAEALRLPLAMNPPARDMIESAYRTLKDARVIGSSGLNASRQKMCFLPVGAEAIPNPAGVAPGMILRLTGGAAVVSVPGRPEESKAVFEGALGLLRDLFPLRASAERELEAPTSDESAMRPVLDRLTEEFPGVWIKSHPPASRRKDPIRVTLQSYAATQKEADTLVEGALRRLLALAGSR